MGAFVREMTKGKDITAISSRAGKILMSVISEITIIEVEDKAIITTSNIRARVISTGSRMKTTETPIRVVSEVKTISTETTTKKIITKAIGNKMAILMIDSMDRITPIITNSILILIMNNLMGAEIKEPGISITRTILITIEGTISIVKEGIMVKGEDKITTTIIGSMTEETLHINTTI